VRICAKETLKWHNLGNPEMAELVVPAKAGTPFVFLQDMDSRLRGNDGHDRYFRDALKNR